MTAKKKKKGGGIFWKLLFLVALCAICHTSFSLFSVSNRFHTGPTAGCPGFLF